MSKGLRPTLQYILICTSIFGTILSAEKSNCTEARSSRDLRTSDILYDPVKARDVRDIQGVPKVRTKRRRVSKVDAFEKMQKQKKLGYMTDEEKNAWRNVGTPQRMLDDITTKIWRTLAIVDIPQGWVLPYCMKFTEIYEDIQKTTLKCQYGGVDWDCIFSELGGGQDGFSMARVVAQFRTVADKGLRARLIRGTKACGRYWQKYKREQARRLLHAELTIEAWHRTYNGEKGGGFNGQTWKPPTRSRNRRFLNYRKIKKARLEKFKETERQMKEMGELREKLRARIKELESKPRLSPEEKVELDKLMVSITTEEPVYSRIGEYIEREDRIELNFVKEIGACLTQQAMRACEPIVLRDIEKLT